MRCQVAWLVSVWRRRSKRSSIPPSLPLSRQFSLARQRSIGWGSVSDSYFKLLKVRRYRTPMKRRLTPTVRSRQRRSGSHLRLKSIDHRRRLSPCVDAEFFEDVSNVDLRGGLADEERLGDLLVAPAAHHELVDVSLSGRESFATTKLARHLKACAPAEIYIARLAQDLRERSGARSV